jgi:hypothetical protein
MIIIGVDFHPEPTTHEESPDPLQPWCASYNCARGWRLSLVLNSVLMKFNRRSALVGWVRCIGHVIHGSTAPSP